MRLLVAFGPTWEAIDPVRILTNRSTGTMGYAIAQEALRRGHRVSCVVGPCPQTPLKKARWIPVEGSREMGKALQKLFPACDALVMAAAISDFRPRRVFSQKLKRDSPLTLRLTATPDFLAGLSRKKGRRVLVGFALESRNLLAEAKRKLREKRLDLLVANRVNGTGHPFGNRLVSVVLLDKKGKQKRFQSISKQVLARRLLDCIEVFFKERM